jgi:hypothetical protein
LQNNLNVIQNENIQNNLQNESNKNEINYHDISTIEKFNDLSDNEIDDQSLSEEINTNIISLIKNIDKNNNGSGNILGLFNPSNWFSFSTATSKDIQEENSQNNDTLKTFQKIKKDRKITPNMAITKSKEIKIYQKGDFFKV